MLLNKRFGINVDYKIDEDTNQMYDVHFRDKNDYEFWSYIDDEIEYQDEIKEQFKYLQSITTINDLLDFFEAMGIYHEYLLDYTEAHYENELEPVLEFGNRDYKYFIRVIW